MVTGCFLDFFVLILQIRRIVKNYGLVVISREGSNPEKYVYEHDILHKYKVNFPSFKSVCAFLWQNTNYPRFSVIKYPRKFRRLMALSSTNVLFSLVVT